MNAVPEAIPEIFNTCCQCTDATCIPPELRDKDTMMKVVLLRLSECLNRIIDIRGRDGIRADGSLDLIKCCPIQFKTTIGKLEEVSHFHGGPMRVDLVGVPLLGDK